MNWINHAFSYIDVTYEIGRPGRIGIGIHTKVWGDNQILRLREIEQDSTRTGQDEYASIGLKPL